MNTTLSDKVSLFHKLKSKQCVNNQTLLIINYDYFLHKRDYKVLLQSYQTIYLIPFHDTNIFFSKDIIFELISDASNLTLVHNPMFDSYIENSVEVSLSSNRHLQVCSVFDFCEQYLFKCYVSDNQTVLTPHLQGLKYFNYRIRLLKKIIDLGIGIPLYILTQPLWLISAFKIFQESPGSIFFKQSRVGIRNAEFTIFKFRSMRLDAEILGAQFSSKNDSRIFNWGKLMRTTRIDELPQLFNILKGELSLIGPRPERKVFIETFEDLIPHYNERHSVKPGISGYAQVMYNYGSGVSDARHKLMYDLYYVKNWSLKLEFKIIFLTLWTIISKKGI